MLFRGFGFDTLFYENTANDESAAEQRSKHQTHTKPKLRRRELRHEQESRSVGVGERFDKHERQNVPETRCDCRKHEFDGVCVVTLSERRRNIA